MNPRVGAAVFGLLVACDGEAPPPAAPRTADALHAWILDGRYASWEHESTVHDSAAGGGARVYLSPALADSLTDDEPVHPVGAAAIRELYAPDLRTRLGWAALVKIKASEAPDPAAWLWLEVLDPSRDADLLVAEPAAPGCIGCHADGADFVRSTLPLR